MEKKKVKTLDAIPMDDIFQEAADIAISKTVTIKEMSVEERLITQTNLPQLDPVAAKTWEDLKKNMSGVHAERFNRVLQELPDREFMRVYIKAIEFFKPKITRIGGTPPVKKDTTINVVIKK